MKRVGNVSSGLSDRPQDRADVARFYAAASPAFVFNLAARQIAAAQPRSLSENARALALINMSSNDSLVASFFTKYYYNFWRPETAIRGIRPDGNSKTAPDTTYRSLIATPCFPSYPRITGAEATRRPRYSGTFTAPAAIRSILRIPPSMQRTPASSRH